MQISEFTTHTHRFFVILYANSTLRTKAQKKKQNNLENQNIVQRIWIKNTAQKRLIKTETETETEKNQKFIVKTSAGQCICFIILFQAIKSMCLSNQNETFYILIGFNLQKYVWQHKSMIIGLLKYTQWKRQDFWRSRKKYGKSSTVWTLVLNTQPFDLYVLFNLCKSSAFYSPFSTSYPLFYSSFLRTLHNGSIWPPGTVFVSVERYTSSNLTFFCPLCQIRSEFKIKKKSHFLTKNTLIFENLKSTIKMSSCL